MNLISSCRIHGILSTLGHWHATVYENDEILKAHFCVADWNSVYVDIYHTNPPHTVSVCVCECVRVSDNGVLKTMIGVRVRESARPLSKNFAVRDLTLARGISAGANEGSGTGGPSQNAKRYYAFTLD